MKLRPSILWLVGSFFTTKEQKKADIEGILPFVNLFDGEVEEIFALI